MQSPDPPAENAANESVGDPSASQPSSSQSSSGQSAPVAESDPGTGSPLPATSGAIAPGVERLDVPRGGSSRIPGHGPSLLFLMILSIVSLGVDIWSKGWAKENLPWSGKVLIPKYLDLRYAENKGGAWGLLATTKEDIRKPFFLLVSVAAILFIMSLYRRLHRGQHALRWGLPLVLGGALGNVFDRIRYGFVVDFIDVHAMIKGEDRHWPTFNVADVAICVGVGLMAIDMFTSKRPVHLGLNPQPADLPREPVAAVPVSPPSQSLPDLEALHTPEEGIPTEPVSKGSP